MTAKKLGSHEAWDGEVSERREEAWVLAEVDIWWLREFGYQEGDFERNDGGCKRPDKRGGRCKERFRAVEGRKSAKESDDDVFGFKSVQK